MDRRIVVSSLLTCSVIALSPAWARAGSSNPACQPSRLMVILDKSSSMETGTINGSTKWSIAVNALDTVLTQFQSKLETGLMVFPQPNQCSPGTVLVSPALNDKTAILGQLQTPPPSGGNYTPMAQTLEAAAQAPSLTDTSVARYAVLITDGWQWCDPYDPSTRFDPVSAVDKLNAAGVTTYVVGFGGAVDALTLNEVAVEAGTARKGCDPTGSTPDAPNPCYYQADNPSDLLAALMSIAGTATQEVCDGIDNDCDGDIDEGLTRPCSTACGSGTEVCVDGTWTGCNAPQPTKDVCDGVDNDCDGTTDPGCDCTPGDTRPCGDTSTVGACHPGTQTCKSDGTWGDCQGSVSPTPEMCDGKDDDCDGKVDNSNDDVGNLCSLGYECVNGSCQAVPPVTPPGDNNGTPDQPAPDGSPTGCACNAGGHASRGSVAGMMLLILGCAFVIRRRRRS